MFSFNLAKSFDKCADFIDQALENGGKYFMLICFDILSSTANATLCLNFNNNIWFQSIHL